MKKVIYVSQRPSSASQEDIDVILKTAKDFNHANGITGVLVSLPDYFYQAIEGPSIVVDALIERIKHDKRHSNMKIFVEASIITPTFGKWSMIHHHINHELADYFWVLSKFAQEPNYDGIKTEGIEMILLGLT